MRRWTVYLVGAAVLLLCAGCGWPAGAPFSGDYADFNPETYNPADSGADGATVAAVQAWFASMEFKRSENEEGKVVPNPALGRDFDLMLAVIKPQALQDPSGQFIGMEQVNALRDLWNQDEWNVEFLDVVMQEAFREGDEAKVELVSGGIRYIGEFFDSPEYRQDSFGDKKGEVFLWLYDDPVNDPLLKIIDQDERFRERFGDIAGKPRWVVIGGLDFSEDAPWGEQLPLD